MKKLKYNVFSMTLALIASLTVISAFAWACKVIVQLIKQGI